MNPETMVPQARRLQALRPGNCRPVPADGLAAAEKLYLRDIRKLKPLTRQAEIELAARIRKGDKQAREQMLKAHLPLVAKIVPEYERLGLPLLDLISEGHVGLLQAVERFDPAKGGRLSTYGSKWINLSIKRALASQCRTGPGMGEIPHG